MHRYSILKVLGDGTYGDVSLGLNKETGEKVAIKRCARAETGGGVIKRCGWGEVRVVIKRSGWGMRGRGAIKRFARGREGRRGAIKRCAQVEEMGGVVIKRCGWGRS